MIGDLDGGFTVAPPLAKLLLPLPLVAADSTDTLRGTAWRGGAVVVAEAEARALAFALALACALDRGATPAPVAPAAVASPGRVWRACSRSASALAVVLPPPVLVVVVAPRVLWPRACCRAVDEDEGSAPPPPATAAAEGAPRGVERGEVLRLLPRARWVPPSCVATTGAAAAAAAEAWTAPTSLLLAVVERSPPGARTGETADGMAVAVEAVVLAPVATLALSLAAFLAFFFLAFLDLVFASCCFLSAWWATEGGVNSGPARP